MNIKLTIFFSLFMASINCFSQDETGRYTTNVTKATIINPGFSYERSIAKRQTLYGQAFMNIAGTFSYSDAYGSSSKFYFDPAVTVQYRYYYNGKRRLDHGKRIDMNSMNYFTSVLETVFSKRPFVTGISESESRPINSLGLAWGFQRNYKKRFSIDLYVGLAVSFAKSISGTYPEIVHENYSQLSPMSQVNIGFWLNRKK